MKNLARNGNLVLSDDYQKSLIDSYLGILGILGILFNIIYIVRSFKKIPYLRLRFIMECSSSKNKKISISKVERPNIT